MDASFIAKITEIVGKECIRTDKRERVCYSIDIGEMPRLVKPFVKAGLPGAVVRPVTEDQIQQIVRAARAAGVSVVPRGLSSSGYGGVLPRDGALVVDMSGWQAVDAVDKQEQVVTCQPGIVWEDLDHELAKDGLEIRLHPSSYPSSTVGGWLAQGGSGFGSFEYGKFQDNVIRARVVDPSGDIQVYEGDALQDLVAEAEGITGIITQVTLKVREKEPLALKLVSIQETAATGAFFTALYERNIPVWSVSFFNPESVRLKKQLPGRTCHSFEQAQVACLRAAERALPEGYLVLCAYPRSRAQAVDAQLEALAEEVGATVLSDTAAGHEWNARTSPMRLKRLGPSIVPTEVVIPVNQAAALLDA